MVIPILTYKYPWKRNNFGSSFGYKNKSKVLNNNGIKLINKHETVDFDNCVSSTITKTITKNEIKGFRA